MSDLIQALAPQNLLEEKHKFFADDSYNPQFTYQQHFEQKQLTSWGAPKPNYVAHAHKMLKLFPVPDSDSTPIFVTAEYIQQQIARFNETYHPEPPIEVHFSPDQVTRCYVTDKEISFQLPIRFTTARFAGLYRHELESHVLRSLNNRRQPWAKHPTDDTLVRRTEEGIASLHTYLFQKQQVIRKSYYTYIAVDTAQRGSLRDVFNTMTEFGIHPLTGWNIAVRTKRGITDTAQPGGFTKDLCYFEGTVQVWAWLMNEQNNPKDVYLGRLSLDQIAEFKPQAKLSEVQYPSFFEDMTSYRANIKSIGEVNQFKELL